MTSTAARSCTAGIPVAEALRNPSRRHVRLLATENGARRLAEEIGDLPLPPEIVRADEISRLLEPDSVHQGFYLESEPWPDRASTR
jgi:23S rRNA (guanosine2251-2'-O)-methyltransferase